MKGIFELIDWVLDKSYTGGFLILWLFCCVLVAICVGFGALLFSVILPEPGTLENHKEETYCNKYEGN